MRANRSKALKTIAYDAAVRYNRELMTREEQVRLYNLVQNPPPGSKIEAAKNFGIDLTLNLRLLSLTPAERAEEMQCALDFITELEHAGRHPRK